MFLTALRIFASTMDLTCTWVATMVGTQTKVEQESIVAEDLRHKAYWSSYCLSAKDNG